MADGDRNDSKGFLPKSKRIKVDLLEERTARSKVQKTDWSLCLFCQRVKHKGVKTLLNVASFEASKVILDVARERGDHYMLVNIGVDLIASEAKYHSACRANYVSKSNLKYHSYKEENEDKECVYSATFETFIQGITSGLSKGIVYDMNFLLDGYREVLKVKGVTSSSNYRSSKLKKRIINYYSGKIVFQKQSDPTKPELVYSSDLSIAGIVQTSTLSTAEVDYVDNRQDVKLDKKNILYHAAQIIKNDIKICTGISIKPLCADEVSIESARKLIPETLRSFLSDVISGPKKRRSHDLDVSSISDTEKDRRVLMVGQDIIHAASNSQVKTPKHIGLAVTVHHLTGSKEIVTLLNRIGHCSSYGDVEIVNTAWAREIAVRSEKSGVVIPSNISPGSFVQFAADNNDLNEETLDGKQTTHATTVVVYQRQQYERKLPSKIYADHSSRRKTLEQPVQSQIIHECSVRGKHPTVTSYAGNESYFVSEESEKSMKELAWFLLRLNRKDVLKSDDNTEGQSVPGWSAFNAEMSTVNVPRTIIGYCPMIAGSPTEYSTIYTVLKTVQEMSIQLGQITAVVTFDLAIYSKAKEVQWRYPEEFQELIIRLGGFHIALNFLALIGKKFHESGIEDVLIESGVYGSSSTQALLQGKSYNRGMRAHKLLMEALMRLQWDAFCSWVAKGGGVSCSQGEEIPSGEEEEELNINLVNSVVERYRSASSAKEKGQAYLVLCNTAVHINTLMNRFKQAASSQLFKFWDDYVTMVLLLLKFVRAERESYWKLHLEATAEMIPHFFSMDRINYARWLPVYIMDMRQLPEKAPEDYDEFINGNHAVSWSSPQSFNQVWTDMALEQSVNLDSKSIGGIVGITQRPGALEKWFLTAHERTATTSATKGMLAKEKDSKTGTTRSCRKGEERRG